MITLLTDFGLSDASVGEMKGAILSIAPDVTVVDMTHGVQAGNVREAAWILSRTWPSFPAGTCHVAVVDPGVGTERRGLAARAGDRFLVGPDNGVLLPTMEALGGADEIRALESRELGPARRGTTFDGRDLFAPTAASLARGARLAELGPEVHDPVGMPTFAPRRVSDGWEAEVIRVDRFGNLVTTLEETFLRATFEDAWRKISVHVGSGTVRGVQLGYDDVPEGETLLSIGGGGTLEISVNRGSARRTLGLAAGETVTVRGEEPA